MKTTAHLRPPRVRASHEVDHRRTVPAVTAAAGRAPILAGLGYWLAIGATYLLQAALWYYPAKAKIFDDGLTAPAAVQEQFAGSFIAAFPGTSVAWAALGLLQAAIFVALLVSLVRGEPRPDRPKPVLLGALGLGLVTFALLLFGSSMTSAYDSVASLTTYFGVTIITIGFVKLLSPAGAER